MLLYTVLATAFLGGLTASNVTLSGASTALCSWLGGACHANASECAAGAAFVNMKDICGGSGLGCCLGARATRAPTAASTNATSHGNSCDRRFERGLRPLAKLYFDEACVVALDLNKYNCPMNALNNILEQYIGGLRVEAFWLSVLSLVALICILQLGGIPRATRPKSESDESVDSPSNARTIESASSESYGPVGSPSRFGTVVWAVYLIAFVLQLLALLLSVGMMVCSYILTRREFRPCMKSFGHGAKILDVAAFAAFFFIPPVLFRLAVIYVTMLSIGVTLNVYLATATEDENAPTAYVRNFMMAMYGPFIVVTACFLALYVLSGSIVFSTFFFLPLGLGMIVLPAISYMTLYFIKRLSLAGLNTIYGQGLYRMLWWIEGYSDDGDVARRTSLIYPFVTVLLCPIIVFGILAAAYVYSGNSPGNNMHAIATMYEYAFQIFWVGEFTMPNFALDFNFPKLENAFTYLEGFAAIEEFTVEEYFAGAHAFDTINFLISILKAVVAFIVVFVAWYSESFGLKPNVDFHLSFQCDDSETLRIRLEEIDEESNPTETDIAVKRLDDIEERLQLLGKSPDVAVKRLDDKVDDIEGRLGLLEKKKEDAKACVVS